MTANFDKMHRGGRQHSRRRIGSGLEGEEAAGKKLFLVVWIPLFLHLGKSSSSTGLRISPTPAWLQSTFSQTDLFLPKVSAYITHAHFPKVRDTLGIFELILCIFIFTVI